MSRQTDDEDSCVVCLEEISEGDDRGVICGTPGCRGGEAVCASCSIMLQRCVYCREDLSLPAMDAADAAALLKMTGALGAMMVLMMTCDMLQFSHAI